MLENSINTLMDARKINIKILFKLCLMTLSRTESWIPTKAINLYINKQTNGQRHDDQMILRTYT